MKKELLFFTFFSSFFCFETVNKNVMLVSYTLGGFSLVNDIKHKSFFVFCKALLVCACDRLKKA